LQAVHKQLDVEWSKNLSGHLKFRLFCFSQVVQKQTLSGNLKGHLKASCVRITLPKQLKSG